MCTSFHFISETDVGRYLYYGNVTVQYNGATITNFTAKVNATRQNMNEIVSNYHKVILKGMYFFVNETYEVLDTLTCSRCILQINKINYNEHTNVLNEHVNVILYNKIIH